MKTLYCEICHECVPRTNHFFLNQNSLEWEKAYCSNTPFRLDVLPALEATKRSCCGFPAVTLFTYPGARGFFLVGGDRIKRQLRVAKRREKNLWYQRITTSLPCRHQFPLIDLRSLELILETQQTRFTHARGVKYATVTLPVYVSYHHCPHVQVCEFLQSIYGTMQNTYCLN